MISIGNNANPQEFSGEIKKAIDNRDPSALLSKLSEDDRKLLGSLLNNQDAREKLLASKQARELISQLFKNG